MRNHDRSIQFLFATNSSSSVAVQAMLAKICLLKYRTCEQRGKRQIWAIFKTPIKKQLTSAWQPPASSLGPLRKLQPIQSGENSKKEKANI